MLPRAEMHGGAGRPRHLRPRFVPLLSMHAGRLANLLSTPRLWPALFCPEMLIHLVSIKLSDDEAVSVRGQRTRSACRQGRGSTVGRKKGTSRAG